MLFFLLSFKTNYSRATQSKMFCKAHVSHYPLPMNFRLSCDLEFATLQSLSILKPFQLPNEVKSIQNSKTQVALPETKTQTVSLAWNRHMNQTTSKQNKTTTLKKYPDTVANGLIPKNIWVSTVFQTMCNENTIKPGTLRDYFLNERGPAWA